MSLIKEYANKLFWALYSPLSAEFWVKTVLTYKVDEVRSAIKEFGDNMTTLEVGCAEGYITRSLAKLHSIKSGMGCDILAQRLVKAPAKAEREGIADKVSFFLSDGRNLPLKDKSTNIVLLLDILEHIPKKEDVIKCLKEAYRVASKGIVISIPQIDSAKWVQRNAKYLDPDHLRILLFCNNSWIYNPDSIQALFKEQKYDFKRITDEMYIIRKLDKFYKQ